jgi:hypothetical protein
MKGSLDFANVNAAALATLPAILCRLLPGGRIEGHEFVALNPRRNDKRPGSFKIRMSGARGLLSGLRDRRAWRRSRLAGRLSRKRVARRSSADARANAWTRNRRAAQ